LYAKEQYMAHGFDTKNDKSFGALWLDSRDGQKHDGLVCAKPNRRVLAYISSWGGRFELSFFVLKPFAIASFACKNLFSKIKILPYNGPRPTLVRGT
jgi:hypothetical protein